MIKKYKKYIRMIIVVLSLFIAIFMYLNAYSIDESKIETGLSEYLNQKSVRIIDVHEIEKGEVKNLIVFFETENSSGISLLHKGLNKKYQINDIDQTTKEISSVSFIVNRSDYTIIYGRSNKLISELQLTGRNQYAIDINSDFVFVVQNNRGYDRSIEIIYENASINKAKQVSIQSNYGSSWRSITIPLRSAIIVILSILLTSLLSKKFDEYYLGEYNELPKDGQRIKQLRPW